MRVRVDFTIEVTEAIRRGIAAYNGRNALATRDEVRTWVQQQGTDALMDVADIEPPDKNES